MVEIKLPNSGETVSCTNLADLTAAVDLLKGRLEGLYKLEADVRYLENVRAAMAQVVVAAEPKKRTPGRTILKILGVLAAESPLGTLEIARRADAQASVTGQILTGKSSYKYTAGWFEQPDGPRTPYRITAAGRKVWEEYKDAVEPGVQLDSPAADPPSGAVLTE